MKRRRCCTAFLSHRTAWTGRLHPAMAGKKRRWGGTTTTTAGRTHLVETLLDTGEERVSRSFQEHLRKSKCWKVGPLYVPRFLPVAGCAGAGAALLAALRMPVVGCLAGSYEPHASDVPSDWREREVGKGIEVYFKLLDKHMLTYNMVIPQFCAIVLSAMLWTRWRTRRAFVPWYRAAYNRPTFPQSSSIEDQRAMRTALRDASWRAYLASLLLMMSSLLGQYAVMKIKRHRLSMQEKDSSEEARVTLGDLAADDEEIKYALGVWGALGLLCWQGLVLQPFVFVPSVINYCLCETALFWQFNKALSELPSPSERKNEV